MSNRPGYDIDTQDRTLQAIVIDMLRVLIGIAGNVQKQMCNVIREMKTPRKNQNKMLEIKITIT